MKSENKSSVAILIAVVLLSTTAGLGCSSKTSPRDEQLERKIIDILLTHKSDDVSKIDMNKVVGSEWRKICIQGPYATKDWFERATGEKLHGYSGLGSDSEEFNNLWIFYKNDTSKFVQIPRGAVMDRFAEDLTLKQTLCTTTSNPFLYLKRQNGLKKFFFIEGE
ncbi:hypothetical protein [Sulfuriferula multivorans]|uniref:hypothetical protein n=1 Tax=Sulfuriferula multivorans TaxID=1559896 RepID=UPI000F5C2089|nr:hypothetical protein [Sulfuriferula multivorans]